MAEAVSSDYGSSSKGRPSIELDVDSMKFAVFGFFKI